MAVKKSCLRSKWVTGLVLLIQLGSVPAFADDSNPGGGFFAALRGVFSSLFGGSRDTRPGERDEHDERDDRDDQSRIVTTRPSSSPSPTYSSSSSSTSSSSSSSELSYEPRREEQAPVVQVTSTPLQAYAQPSVVPVAASPEPEYRAPIVFARRAGYPPAIFKPHERFDVSDPESFARLSDALADDEQANALITDVLNETGKSSLSELVTFKTPQNPFQHGVSMITTDRTMPDAVLAGWPALNSDGLFMVDPNPGERLHVVVELNPKSEMIDLYATVIHELTHVQGSLQRMKSENLNELLTFKDADVYSNWNIKRPGGELDAFSAEISAVIRYRNRYKLPYEPFFTPKNEVYFDQRTGNCKNRNGLEESIAGRGNGMAYYSTGLEKFAQMMQTELRYCETLQQQLRSSPSYDQRAEVREEARRLDLRIQRIRSQYPGY